MHRIKTYMEKIINNGKVEDMEKIEEYFYKLMCQVHMTNPEMTKWIKEEMKIMACGKVIDEEEANEIVKSLKPSYKWEKETTDTVIKQYNLNVSSIPFFIVMNLMYSDMKNVLGDGNEEESLKSYINATLDFINDEDAPKDKLYDYIKYVLKK